MTKNRSLASILGGALGTFVGTVAANYFLVGLCIWVVWNAIAYQLNLPQFSYWVCVAAAGVLNAFRNIFRKD